MKWNVFTAGNVGFDHPSGEGQLVTVCQDHSDKADNRGRVATQQLFPLFSLACRTVYNYLSKEMTNLFIFMVL